MDQMTAIIRLDRALRAAQAVLRDHLTSGTMTADEALRRLRDVLEDEDFVRFQRALEGTGTPDAEPIKPEDPLPYR
ncbi:hypothetical protein ACUN0C_02475 [Faunimonas sp. B44]|uniref:hypothetical protein n=1 Tax=Faunimonas sp. B44 TaxID=3461493 RepID=UPI0040439A57